MQRVKCQISNQNTVGGTGTLNTLACWDGYTDRTTTTWECVGSCGIQKYGSASFNTRAGIENSECLDCSISCYECAAAGSGFCRSCKTGLYL